MKMKKYIGKIIMTLILTLVIIIQMSIIPTNAEPTTKKMTVTIGEGKVDQSDLSKTITIPNLKEIVNITSNTGSVTYSIEGEKLIINATEGKPSRSVYNEKKYSKVVTETRTGSSDNFPDSISFNKDGYSTILTKNGSSKDTSTPWSTTKLDGGLSATSIQYTNSTGKNFYGISVYNDIRGESYEGNGYVNLYLEEYKGYQDIEYVQIARIYNSRLNYSKDYDRPFMEELVGVLGGETINKTYNGIEHKVYIKYNPFIRKAASNGHYGIENDYTIHYRIPSYTQNYIGTGYKPGYDNYYKYKIEIEYIDNSNPTMKVSFNENEYFGKEKPISISGIVKDQDIGDILSIKYTIDGVSTHNNRILLTDIKADRTNQSFSQNIEIDDSLPEGDYTIKIWAEDDKGGKSDEVSGTIKIDKTPPTMKIIIGK